MGCCPARFEIFLIRFDPHLVDVSKLVKIKFELDFEITKKEF
jgi:hypothetical protein